MVFFNYSTMQMAAKVVYYGPGLCGKTTNLQWIFEHTSTDSRGEMVSLATETDRTLFFDLLPIDVGSIAGFSTRIQLYTVPGQVFYNTTRKLVLKGVDGVVFVADSQRPMLQANVESFQNLEENLAEMGLSLDNIPVVLQYNKRDLPGICSFEELDQALNRQDWSAVEASALNGQGVFETLKTISKATLLALKKRLTKSRPEGTSTARRPRPPVARAPLQPRPVPGRKPRAPAPVIPSALSPSEASPPDEGISDPSLESVVSELNADIELEPPALESAQTVAIKKAAKRESAARESVVVEATDPELGSDPPVPVADAVPESGATADTPAPGGQVMDGIASFLSEDSPGEAADKQDIPDKPVPKEPVEEATLPKEPPKRRRRKTRVRSAGFDALQELEKLRRQAIDPRTAAENGKREIKRSVRMTLNRDDFSRAHRVSLTIKVEDADLQVVDEARYLHVDLEGASSLDELLLRLNIALASA